MKKVYNYFLYDPSVGWIDYYYMLVITSFEVKNNLCFVKIFIEVLFRGVISNKQCY
jgi:hypothetical protein